MSQYFTFKSHSENKRLHNLKASWMSLRHLIISEQRLYAKVLLGTSTQHHHTGNSRSGKSAGFGLTMCTWSLLETSPPPSSGNSLNSLLRGLWLKSFTHEIRGTQTHATGTKTSVLGDYTSKVEMLNLETLTCWV